MDSLKMKLINGKEVVFSLGEIIFDVIEAGPNDVLSMRQLMINQSDYHNIRIEFFNESDKPITVEGLDFKDIFKFTTGQAYTDFNLSKINDSAEIPPGESLSFLFRLDQSDGEYIEEKEFFFMLPFVVYKYDGMERKMPAQTQATIITPAITPEYILKLLEVQ